MRFFFWMELRAVGRRIVLVRALGAMRDRDDGDGFKWSELDSTCLSTRDCGCCLFGVGFVCLLANLTPV
jgi:hypothetical protein